MGNGLIQPPWAESKYVDHKKADSLHVIGVGLPRTGTSSLKVALDILGFGPCHHMLDLIGKSYRLKQFIRAYNGKKVDFDELMAGYGSTVDTPTLDFYQEIQQVYPKSKLILTVRDSDEKWFQSYESTIGSFVRSNLTYYSVLLIRFLRLHHTLARKCDEKLIHDYGEMGPLVHRKHNERIVRENNNNNLLVFNVKEGWAPLCKFLEVDIPEGIPFPNINDGDTFTSNIRFARILGAFSWMSLCALSMFLAYIII